MTRRPVLVDTTRLFTRLKHASPTGIDRVDLAYARHYLADGRNGRAVAITPFGTRLLPDRSLRDLLRVIDGRWNERRPAERDPVLAAIRQRLAGRPVAAFEPPRPWLARLAASDVVAEARKLRALDWPGVAGAPHGAVYLHTSHLRLDRPNLFGWLDGRPDIRPVFFVHDLIPIEFPEYGVPGESERHRTRMATIARRAAAVVANSRDVATKFDDHLATQGLRRPPVLVAPLGVEPAFAAMERRPENVGRYFVVCSTIEARKNHLLLLQVWRDLAATLGPDTPKLVIVGRRGWESESAVDLLDRSPAIRAHVIEATSLSTAGLAELVAGARALLMPSFAEGYGIPVVEALATGTPVIASDLNVFREIAGNLAVLLHPLDGPGWRNAILSCLRDAPSRVDGFQPPGWPEHFARVDDLLTRL